MKLAARMKEVYESTMKYISEQNAWVASGKELIAWWTKQLPGFQGK